MFTTPNIVVSIASSKIKTAEAFTITFMRLTLLGLIKNQHNWIADAHHFPQHPIKNTIRHKASHFCYRNTASGKLQRLYSSRPLHLRIVIAIKPCSRSLFYCCETNARVVFFFLPYTALNRANDVVMRLWRSFSRGVRLFDYAHRI